MKAISLHQPWASLILLGYKHYETRSWATTHRGPLAIHAAKYQSQEYRQLCLIDPEISAALAAHGLTYDALPFGALLGTCQVGEMHSTNNLPLLSLTELACGDYSPDRWAWALSDVQALVRPVLCRGFQQLWTVPADYLPVLQTRQAFATALTQRYGGRPVQADDICDLMNLTQQDDTDTTLHVQASREALVDWYQVTLNSAGQLDPTSITQLPF